LMFGMFIKFETSAYEFCCESTRDILHRFLGVCYKFGFHRTFWFLFGFQNATHTCSFNCWCIEIVGDFVAN
jgi:hypothetical protein